MRRSSIVGGFLHAGGRCVDGGGGVVSRLLAFPRSVAVHSARDFGRCTGNARTRRVVGGCALIRTETDSDSAAIRSTRDSARVLRITCPRCSFMDRLMMPNSYPICLSRRPETTSCMTWRSRAPDTSKPLQSLRISARSERACDRFQVPAGDSQSWCTV
jgi:hypothetical protein